MNLPRRLTFRLGEVFALLFALGFGLAALRTGDELASAALIGGLVAFIAAVIAAVLGREGVQTFSIGFVIASGIYGAVFYFLGNEELRPYVGHLPTTRLFHPPMEAVRKVTYVGTTDFLAVAHLLFGLSLGYLGGRFALFVRRRPLPSDRTD